MNERDEVQGTRNAAAEKTNVVSRRRLTCDCRLSVATEAIVCVIQRGCEYRAMQQLTHVSI
jgi:hypothetical protein